MELSRRKVMITFTILGLSASILMGFSHWSSTVYENVYKFIISQEAGGYRWLSWLFQSPWTDVLVQYLFVLGAAHIPAYMLLCWLPKKRAPLRKLSGWDFVICAVASLGLGYLLNFAGLFINSYIGNITGKDLMEMNPVTEIAMDFTPSMLMYTCIVGPFMEELMFRGFLLKRARLFGDRTAVVYTALMFGLMHGNIAQFLYAAVIGLVFGYVAVKTNSIRYTVLLHILVNTFSTMVAFGETIAYGIGGTILSLVYLAGVFLVILCLIICAGIILIRYGRFWYLQLTYHNGPLSDHKIFVYLNPGFVLYVLICAAEFLTYIF
ncbi:MAG: CPBP family intramembrane metalloprotease [Lachnospiraceae bacterium]|nr:CPBP family intramembrane metalloprotease [Lachnospiraceae bacterium]